MYTIAYRVQYTCTCVHARIPNRQPREDPRDKNPRVGQVGEDPRACLARASRTGKSPDTVTDFRAYRVEVGEDVRVSVGVGVGVGPMKFKLKRYAARSTLTVPTRAV